MVPVAGVAIARWRKGRRAATEPGIPSSDVAESRATASGREAWIDRIREEASRCFRYEHPAAVVVFRLGVFDRLVATGSFDGGRLCRAVVASLRRSARATDVVFGDGSGVFHVLLLEAEETGARAYVDRLTQVLRPWIEIVDTEVRLTAAWAGTSELADLATAHRLAEARLVGAEEGWLRSAFVCRVTKATTWLDLDLAHEPLTEGVTDQRSGAPGAKLLRQVGDMTPDRVRADAEAAPDVRRPEVAGEEPEDLSFADGQDSAGLEPPDRVVNDHGGDAAMEIALAAHHRLDRVHEVDGVGPLDDVSSGTGE